MKRNLFSSCLVMLLLFVVARSDILAQVHSVSTDTPRVLMVSGREFTRFEEGYMVLSWKEFPPRLPGYEDLSCPLAFFYAFAVVVDDHKYEFIMKEPKDRSDADQVVGPIIIYIDGQLKGECTGSVQFVRDARELSMTLSCAPDHQDDWNIKAGVAHFVDF